MPRVTLRIGLPPTSPWSRRRRTRSLRAVANLCATPCQGQAHALSSWVVDTERMNGSTLLQSTDAGLYCPDGDFHIDPWLPVPRAVITHAHTDHLRWGCGSYLVAAPGLAITRARLEPGASVRAIPYGEVVRFGGVQVYLHPAGHILGSAQVRVEEGGEVWVVSGDYKREPSPPCAPFESLRAHTFVTESTFGLPIFRWPPDREVFDA